MVDSIIYKSEYLIAFTNEGKYLLDFGSIQVVIYQSWQINGKLDLI